MTLGKMSNEAKGGLALLAAAMLAFMLANSPLASFYQAIGHFSEPSLLFFVNEGLMTLFFLVVGLEIRAEVRSGELNSFAKSALPAVAAFGGMIVPACVYLYFAGSDPVASRGYGIPVATDIAFALSVLSIFGTRVPLSLKAFLMALAIFDDIGAILLIALFYSHNLSVWGLGICALIISAMILLRRFQVTSLLPYLGLTLLLWFAALESGIHATIAGVVAAFLLPISATGIKYKLDPWVTFAVLPLFAFLNAGVSLNESGAGDIFTPVSLGITLGLLIGKPVGVFLFTWLCVMFKLAPKPHNATWLQILGIASICGIGFTMSLFVGMLAFENSGETYQVWARTGVLLGSAISAAFGSLILGLGLRRPRDAA
jgi:NhaA family Na+:H+ antiporter